MCIDCGCSTQAQTDQHQHEPRTIRIEEDLLAKNKRLAADNRQLFASNHLLVLNLVSAPGSGKTSILEQTLADLKGELNFSVLEGDQQTTNDADRIAATGVPVKQINTGAGCHLDAHMVGHGVESFDLVETDILMIENVGNLVCPASFDLGEDHKVAVLSITEGEDKPVKYPLMFRECEAALLNKIDLLPYLDFDKQKAIDFIHQVHPQMPVFEISAKTGEGFDAWIEWLKNKIRQKA